MNNIDTKKDLVTQILSLAIEISTTSIIDIFVDYSSHVKGLSIRVILNGWGNDTTYNDYDLNKMIYMDLEDSEQKLQEVLDYLKKIKEEL
jgi:hypothetical protein